MIESFATRAPAPVPARCEAPARPSRQAADTDGALMACVAVDGDRHAFSRLIDRYKDPLVTYLTRLAGCPDRAQDFAQETFLRLYRHADQYRDSGQLKAYLFRIATNLVRSEERRAQRWRRLSGLLSGAGARSAPSRSDPTLMESSEENGEARVLREEQRRMLTAAIAALPLPYRAVLVLAEIEDMPQREIAALLSCREGTVKSRLFRARHKLKEALGPYWRPAAVADSAEETS